MDHRPNTPDVLPRLFELRKRLQEQRITKEKILALLSNTQHPEHWSWLAKAAESLPN